MNNESSLIFQNGAPYCQRFDDIYFDTTQGYQQSQTVFIEGNNLIERFSSLEDTLVIAETGFGSGLNFLLTIKAFIERGATKKTRAKLHFISTEKYPMTREQLAQSLALFPEFSDLAKELIQGYPKTPSTESNSPFTGNYWISAYS